MECIERLRIQQGKEGIINTEGNDLDKFIFDIPEKITSKFPSSLKTLLVEKTSENWFEYYGKLKNFYFKKGHSNPAQKTYLGKWCQYQRTGFRNKTIPKNRIKLLRDINFIWNIDEFKWHESYQELKKIYLNTGSSCIQVRSSKLGYWTLWQRQKYESKDLTKSQIELLNNIEFVWDLNEYKWNERYRELKSFYIKTGHSKVEQMHSSLGRWVGTQRRNFKKNQLSKQKIDLLGELDFIWDTKDAIWNSNYQSLKDFFINNGHPNISVQESKFLYKWSQHQRSAYKKNKLSKNRIELLDELEFTWDSNDEGWNSKYQQLKEFYSQEKHSSPPKDSPLYPWCNRQRVSNNKNQLSEKKINLLNSLGFVWNKREESWKGYFIQLKEFFDKEGHISISNKENSSLYIWCNHQRQRYKSNKLSNEKIDLLESIEFNWKI
tara:strand:- start:138 stop:1442 length:1305 start_codon:yes stop_codon:yes gene_type:complete